MKATPVNIFKSTYDEYCGRAGKGKSGYFGNPFKLEVGQTIGSTLIKYAEYFYKRLQEDPEFKAKVLSLNGKKLACFCSDPKKCHTGIMADYINQTPEYNPDIFHAFNKLW